MGAPDIHSSSSSTPKAMTPATDPNYRFPWVALLILAAAIFVAVTSEFVPVGLLLDLSRTFDVSEAQVGSLVTIFAGAVVLSAAPLTALTHRIPRKTLVIIVLLVFAVGNGLAAVAPTFEVLVVARIIGGVAHGLFWSVVGAYASYMVPRHHIGRAVAITSGGGSAAFILGVPLGTALGHEVGWRLTFAILGGAIFVIILLVLKFLPAIRHGEQLNTGEIAIPMRKDRTLLGVIFICSIVVVVMTGQYLFYTYISPYLTQMAGFDEETIPGVLFLFGGAGAIGLVFAGFLGDRFPRGALIVSVGVVAASVLAIALFPTVTGVVLTAIVVWAIAFGGIPAMMQAKLLHTASARIRDASSAWYTSSFNLAIGFGAFLGGAMLNTYGLRVLPFADFALLLAGLVLIIVSNAILRSRERKRVASRPTNSIPIIRK